MGMSRWQVFRTVVWPNMIRLAWPAYTNEVVFLFHATALVYFTLPVIDQQKDLMNKAGELFERDYNAMLHFGVAGLYFLAASVVIFFVSGGDLPPADRTSGSLADAQGALQAGLHPLIGVMFHIGTSWKMHKTRAEARSWVEVVTARPNPLPGGLGRFIIPPFTAIDATREAAAGSDFRIGAQTVHHEAEGAYTGDVSVAMLADAGCTIVEIGHSERRAACGETDFLVAKKVRRVLDHGLQPLVCLGDSAAERDAGAQTVSVLRQAIIALSDTDAEERARCLLAYEPYWAIGVGGTSAEPAEVGRVHDCAEAAVQ